MVAYIWLQQLVRLGYVEAGTGPTKKQTARSKPALALLRQGQVLLKKHSARRKPALAFLRQGQVLLKQAGTDPTAEAIGKAGQRHWDNFTVFDRSC